MKSIKLSYENFYSSIGSGLINLQQNEEFVDMTLAADSHLVKVHKNVVSLASPYIKEMIKNAPCTHPVVYLSNIKYHTLCMILEYIYTGEVQVSEDVFNNFVDAAKELHIIGLTSLLKRNEMENQNPPKRPLIKLKSARILGNLNIPHSVNNESEDLYNAIDYSENSDIPNEDISMCHQDQNQTILDNINTIQEGTNNMAELQNIQLVNVTNNTPVGHDQLDGNLHAYWKFTAADESNKPDEVAVYDQYVLSQNTINHLNQEIPIPTSDESCLQKDNMTEENNEPSGQINIMFPQNDMPELCTSDSTSKIPMKELSIELNDISKLKDNLKSKSEKILGKLTYTLTRKGQIQLIYNRYMYYIHHRTRDGKRRFRCIDYRGGHCPAVLDMNDEKILKRVHRHNHGFHDIKIEMSLKRQEFYETLAEARNASEEETRRIKEIRDARLNRNIEMEILPST